MANENGLLSESIVYCTALYLAAQNGHKDVVEYISELPIRAKSSDMFKITAFFLAAMKGNLNDLKYFTENISFADDFEKILHENVDDSDYDDEDCVDLYEAAKKGSIKQMELQLNNGLKIDSCDDNFNTALHIAAENANSRAVEFLIEKGANLKCNNKESNTPFHVAAKTGSVQIVKTMLKKGALINNSNSNWDSAIHLACENGHTNVVKLLIKEGADVNAKNKNGDSALHFAVKSGSNVIVRDLLENGADVHAKNKSNESALVHANDKMIIYLLNQNGADITYIDEDGRTLLHQAAKYDYPVLAEYLIEQGLEIDKFDKMQRTPLAWSAYKGSCRVMQILLMNGANIENIGKWYPNMCGIREVRRINPLHHAAFSSYEATGLLLGNRADVDATSDQGETALMFAANYGKYKIAKLLLIYGANKDLKSSKNKTALEYAQHNNFENVVKLLTEWKK